MSRGDAAYDSGRYRQAYEIYQGAVELAPRNPEALADRGFTAFVLRRYLRAEQDLKTSLLLDQDCSFCRNPLAWISFYYGDYDDARRWLREAHAHDDRDDEDDALSMIMDGPFRAASGIGSDYLTGPTPRGHYRLSTDLGVSSGRPSGGRSEQWNAAASVLDWAYEQVYTQAFDFPKDVNLVLNVVIFANSTRYVEAERLLGMQPGSTYGVYAPELKTVLLYDDAASAEGMLAGLHTGTTETLLHEGLHQFLDYYVDDIPVWFDEGLGEYYGSAAVRDGKLIVGVPSRDRLPEIKHILCCTAGPVPLRDLLLMDYDQFTESADWEDHYAQAWAFVHYLYATAAGRRVLRDYLVALMRGASQKEAFERVFVPLDPALLERGWRDHVSTLDASEAPSRGRRRLLR